MGESTTIDGVNYGPLAMLIGVWKGDQMRYTETTVLDIYEKKSYDHTDVNTLKRQR